LALPILPGGVAPRGPRDGVRSDRGILATMTRFPIGLSRIDELGTILSVWAHPDDETYLAGGLMAAAVAGGQPVTCVSATAGERGTDDPATWPPDRLGQVRRWEAQAAMAILGVTDHRFLDLPDGGLANVDAAEPVSRLTAMMSDLAPDTILTFGPDGATFHPDHRTVSRWVDRAWKLAGRPGQILHAAFSDEHLETWGEEYERWGVYMSDERPVGVPVDDLAIRADLAGPLLDQKIAALCAMFTQIAPSVALLGDARFRELNQGEYFVAAPSRWPSGND
jgi:LmbE family N-acetylglucosaminyl deacetylase